MSKVRPRTTCRERFESNDLSALDTAYRVSAYPRDWGNADVSGGEDVLITDLHVDGDDYKPPDEYPIYNGHEHHVVHSPPPDSPAFVAATAQSPPPPPESSTQTPAPVPEPKLPQGPYRPNYKPYVLLSGHTRSISSVKFSPDGTMLASCGKCSSVHRISSRTLDMSSRVGGSKLPISW